MILTYLRQRRAHRRYRTALSKSPVARAAQDDRGRAVEGVGPRTVASARPRHGEWR